MALRRTLSTALVLRAVANRLGGILHGCLRHHAFYDEHTAWHATHSTAEPAAA
ncbi:hypothetical protein [Georgenia sp. SYP-B2076]|uniref:hypothetical protein n=1 Tax=Georgenia sp. SYP-B2076 TaxID=2495881 RepID=UPI00197A6FD0|nr:hypothetical protein [Georgenia sp. SYP-B2076]